MTARPLTVDATARVKRIPLWETEGFVPLGKDDPPLTIERAREILGPHVDEVIRRLHQRVAQRHAERCMKEASS